MNKKIGLIGSGNMAQAIIGGIINSKLTNSENIVVSDKSEEALNTVKEKYKVETTTDNVYVASKSEILILAVKPNIYPVVIKEIKGAVDDSTIIVSIAAGKSISSIESAFGKPIKLIRVMPNTPAMVGEGMAALCPNTEVPEDEISDVLAIFNSFGKGEVIDEKLIDAVTAVSGSSPAYVYMFIEALADGAVLQGMPRDKAYKFAAQAVLGSAKMVLETGEHPGKLKDNVCSPGGTTIEAVATLEKLGFRSAVISAVNTCAEKSQKMSQ
ncbi:pyrroline-5-carboxylate reductase [Clostridium cellulovorans]|uniref:Pyrroline-5-carboxylate reductase n=1 Tax=Clostridium cellulovorans (strain ATCC 35296 / DSM 3052 / OCM 3 / 743B) TaxID=573061 RepID=D9SRK2_CLOC7|nr:pyrroline-5-carboxylate reductase [Clostridium cellulovorans]ADL52431.1 pyrroline-5-carboxylate reductase [Clostridium cellulovorans 743B]